MNLTKIRINKFIILCMSLLAYVILVSSAHILSWENARQRVGEIIYVEQRTRDPGLGLAAFRLL